MPFDVRLRNRRGWVSHEAGRWIWKHATGWNAKEDGWELSWYWGMIDQPGPGGCNITGHRRHFVWTRNFWKLPFVWLKYHLKGGYND